MKQLLQDLKKGSTELYELPVPNVKKGHLLIKTHYSLLSSGTEKMLVNFGKANIIDKAFQQPEKVKEVLYKAKNDGIKATFEAVNSKLDELLQLGYSNVGKVIDIGDEVNEFEVGDLVISNGPHAEIVLVPKNLCAKLPVDINQEAAVFTVLGSIGLQGIRLAKPNLGETYLVSGMGLIGLLTAQLLISQNCKVLGIEIDKEKCRIAESLGIKVLNLSSGIDPVSWCINMTNGIGVDGAIITASTVSTEPIHVAAEACRKRGKIILIGSTGLDLKRNLFYKKELTFQVSCSYGPGRYDPNYEEKGIDYPIGFVRWTEKRNFEAIIDCLNQNKINTEKLISHRFSFDKSREAYSLLTSNKSSLGIVFKYPQEITIKDRVELNEKFRQDKKNNPSLNPSIGVIGTGNYAKRNLIPLFYKFNANLVGISASSGLGPTQLGGKFGFKYATTNVGKLISDKEINSIVIATRHDSHAEFIVDSLNKRKNIFVEKPLCLNKKELNKIKNAYTGETILMVGFNRRFSPLIKDLKRQLKDLSGVKSFIYTCNAGFIDADHWIHQPDQGGGRLLGEACHFVDLIRFLADSEILDMKLTSTKDNKINSDTFSLQIKFRNGSIGTIHYFSNGNKSYPKENIKVFGNGRIFELNNFRTLRAWGVPNFKIKRLFSQDKGQSACVKAFLDAIYFQKSSPIPIKEIIEVHESILKVI